MDFKEPTVGEIIGWVIILMVFFAFLFFGLHLESKGF
jgi:hypothetical protein